MFGRVPRWLGTALMMVGVVGLPGFYYAVGVALRREQACVGAAAAQCAADAAFWREFAIAGFVITLGVAVIGVILDRLLRRR